MLLTWVVAILGGLLVGALQGTFKVTDKFRKGCVIASLLIIVFFLLIFGFKIYFKDNAYNHLIFASALLSSDYLFWMYRRIKRRSLRLLTKFIFIIPMLGCFLMGVTGMFGLFYSEFYSNNFQFDDAYHSKAGYNVHVSKMGSALDPDGLRVALFKDIPYSPFQKLKYIDVDYTFCGDIENIKFTEEDNFIKIKCVTDQNNLYYQKEIKIN